jgi:AcrR family transcriptional regulator
VPEAKLAQPSTKERIRRAALSLFAARGYAAVSMRDIADAVGVRPGGLYNHFPGKQDLLADLMRKHMETLLAALEEALEGETAPRDALEAFARFHTSYNIDFPDDVFIAYMELRSLDPGPRAEIGALRDTYEHRLRAILERGAAAGVFTLEDSKVTARMLLAMLTGVTTWYREGGPRSRAEIVETYTATALRAVGAA